MSVELSYDLRALERLGDRLEGMSSLSQRSLLSALGAHLEDSVVARIEEGGPGPNGEVWPDWSERYARTRGPGKALLRDEGELLTSIQYVVNNGDELEVGSNLEYAATHQYGDDDREIPARPYLGLSPEDEAAIEAEALDWMSRHMGAAA